MTIFLNKSILGYRVNRKILDIKRNLKYMNKIQYADHRVLVYVFFFLIFIQIGQLKN